MKAMIINLLKTPAGNYSRKSLIALTSFFITMLIGIFLIVADCFLTYRPTQMSKDIFDSLLMFVSLTIGLAVADKKIASKPPETKIEE